MGAETALGPSRLQRWVTQPVLAGAVGLVALLAFTLVYVPRERAQTRSLVDHDLAIRADTRLASIERWVGQSLADAATLAASPATREIAAGSAPATAVQARHWREIVSPFLTTHHYLNAALLRPAGAPLLARGDAWPEECLEAARFALEPGHAAVRVHRSGGAVHVSFVMALARDGSAGIVVEEDGARWLLPFLAAPPMTDASAEAVLVRREGPGVLFLSRLRHDAAPPLTLRRPLDVPGFAAAAAVSGAQRSGRFFDYRGVAVLAAVRRVEATAWGLVVKVDEDEALAAARRRIATNAIAATAIYALLAGATLLVALAQRAADAASLAAARAQVGLMLDQANDAVLFIAPDGRIREANRRAEELYGRTRHELLSLRALDLWPQEARADGEALRQRVLRDGASVYETAHVRADGTRIPVQVSSRLAAVEGRSVVVAVVRDIAERKRADEALRRERETLERIAESSPVGIVRVDRDGGIVFANTRAEQILGLTRDQITRRTYNAPDWKITGYAGEPFPDGQLPFSLVKSRCAPVHDVRHAIEFSDGRRVLLSINASPFLTAGEFDGMVATLEDVTERVRAAEALAAADRTRATILESVSDAFVALDRDWRYTYVNRRAAELFGRRADDLVGKHIWTEFPEGVGQNFYHAYHKAMAERIPVQIEEYYPPWDRWYENRIYPSDGGLAIYFTEITERKHAEALLVGQKNVLERIAAGAALPETLDALLRVVEEQSAEMLGSILLLDDDGLHVRHGAAPRLPASFTTAIDGQPIGERAGSCGTAAYRREAVVVEDIATDPLWADYRELALAHGLRACWSTPIFDNDRRVLGTFALYFRQPGRPTERHLKLIDMATHTAAIAIIKHRTEARIEKQAEALRAGEARLRNLFEQAADGIFLLTPDHRYLDANAEGLRMLGYTRQELLELRLPDVLAEHERRRLDVEVPAMMAGMPHLAEWVHLRKDGSTFSAEVSARVLSRTEYLAIVRDMTARKKAEAALRESEERFRAFMDHLPGMANIKDRELRYLYVNPALASLFGREPGDLVGRRTEEFLQGPQVDQNRALDESVVATREPRTAVLDGDGSETAPAYITTKFPLTLADGRVAVGSIGLDITPQRRAELEVRRLNAELEERVAQRTAELHAKNRELETFSYSVSHDLKAPLRGIDGYSRLLLEEHADKLDDEARTFLHNVRQATTRMGQLIDDLLAYSRLDRRRVQAGRVDLRSLAEGLVADRSEEIRSRGVAVKVDVPDIVLTTDREGLAIALRNLFENALKFTRGVAAPAIEIGGCPDASACRLWVRDNGIGFDMKFHDRIFDVFQRLHRSEDYPGTGVGLAMVRRALERMGGRAWAESEPGKGATFYLEIPRQT